LLVATGWVRANTFPLLPLFASGISFDPPAAAFSGGSLAGHARAHLTPASSRNLALNIQWIGRKARRKAEESCCLKSRHGRRRRRMGRWSCAEEEEEKRRSRGRPRRGWHLPPPVPPWQWARPFVSWRRRRGLFDDCFTCLVFGGCWPSAQAPMLLEDWLEQSLVKRERSKLVKKEID
jgi:hypothetical protein